MSVKVAGRGCRRSLIQRPARSEDDQLGGKGNQALDEDGGQGTRGGVVDTTTSRQTRDDHSNGKGHGDCDGNEKCLAAAVTGFGDNDYDDNSVNNHAAVDAEGGARGSWSLE